MVTPVEMLIAPDGAVEMLIAPAVLLSC